MLQTRLYNACLYVLVHDQTVLASGSWHEQWCPGCRVYILTSLMLWACCSLLKLARSVGVHLCFSKLLGLKIREFWHQDLVMSSDVLDGCWVYVLILLSSIICVVAYISLLKLVWSVGFIFSSAHTTKTFLFLTLNCWFCNRQIRIRLVQESSTIAISNHWSMCCKCTYGALNHFISVVLFKPILIAAVQGGLQRLAYL